MEISNEQLKSNMEKHLGKDVLILKPHVWEDEQGKTVRVEFAKGINKMGMEHALQDRLPLCTRRDNRD